MTDKIKNLCNLMAHCILFIVGLVTFWTGLKIADQVHRLALASVGVVSISWGYFYSPWLFQCLSGILILSGYQIYLLMVESSL